MTDTLERPDQHYAFKKGYRTALQHRPMTHMPSYVRREAELRSYFEQGWQQARQELEAGHIYNKTPNLRHRAGWIIMTALAGLATAYLIIQQSNYTPLSEIKKLRPMVLENTVPNPIEKPIKSYETLDNQHDLALLTEDERRGLIDLDKNFTAETADVMDMSPVMPSEFSFTSRLINTHAPEQSVDTQSVPKYIRLLIFETRVVPLTQAKLTIRWLWQRQLIQEQSLELVDKEKGLFQSQQSMYSARQGQWDIEILDLNKQVLYRYSFLYGVE